jgi:threonine dehydratase
MTTHHLASLDAVRAAAVRIAPHIRSTPIMHKEVLAQRFGVPVFLKGEHLQRTGSFKIRGAVNLAAQLPPGTRGLVAASAGNHAQGVAVAAATHGLPSRIYMPEDATLSKVEATRSYGADVQLEGAALAETIAAARAWAHDAGWVFVHPFDDPHIIEGQATLGLEIVEQVPDVATVLLPIGGGGLFAGVASVVRELRPECRIIGVQARACGALAQSLAAGAPVDAGGEATIADGIAVRRPGTLTFPIIRDLMDQLVLVDDDHISRTMLWLIERAKQIVEGAGAAALAALQTGEVEPAGPTVVVLSGGNIDPMQLLPVVRHGLTTVGRFLTFSTKLPDRPGELSRLLALMADLKVNILSVEHHREGVRMHVSETRIELTLQTRNHEHVTEVLDALEAAGYDAQPRIV